MGTEDGLVRVLTALVRLEMDLGPEAFQQAARHSLLFIADIRQMAALEKHRTPMPPPPPPDQKVVAITEFRRRRPTPGGSGEDTPA